MRLWSLNPAYLDSKGLVALWREALLARAVLKNQTKGYRHHPQLERFQQSAKPISAINSYLRTIYAESIKRGYHFDVSKLDRKTAYSKIPVTKGQLGYELGHLKAKLKSRDFAKYKAIRSVTHPKAHPLFRVIPGNIEPWEKTDERRS